MFLFLELIGAPINNFELVFRTIRIRSEDFGQRNMKETTDEWRRQKRNYWNV